MKILAIEVETEGVRSEQYQPFLKTEAAHIWQLYQSGVIREVYFRADRSEAVLMLECRDVNDAQQILSPLPLVQAGLIRFEIIPLLPYPGFARLFAE